MTRTRDGGKPRDRKFDVAARRAIAATVRAGAKAYDRTRDLPALIRLDPRELGKGAVCDASAILARLERALRAERQRARSGHWTYDLNRHIALHQAYAAERERLANDTANSDARRPDQPRPARF